MNQEIIKTISEELNVRVHQIEAVLSLLEEGNTVPFIARYRKEKTGALDEDQIRTIDKYYQYQVNLLKRKVGRHLKCWCKAPQMGKYFLRFSMFHL